MKNKSFVLILSFAVIIVLATIPSIFFYVKYRQISTLISNPALAAKEEMKALKEQVGKLMVIPKDEDPLVITVMDSAKLKDQPFFAKANNGDRVLVFQNAKMAILYNPIEKKIVNVGPFNPPNPSPSLAPGEEEVGKFNLPTAVENSPTPKPEPLTISLFNSTDSDSVVDPVIRQIHARYPDAVINNEGKSTVRNYEWTTLFNLKANKKTEETALVKSIKPVTVTELPEGEDVGTRLTNTENVSFIIIIGRDKLPKESPTPTQ